MLLLKSSVVLFNELASALSLLPKTSFGIEEAQALALWRQWHQQGSLQIGRIDRISLDGSCETQALGITIWLTDDAVLALSQTALAPCVERLYQGTAKGLPWLMQTAQIRQAHKKNALHLMVLHFWTRSDVSDAAFHPVFLQAHASFRDIHQGFGVQSMFQEVPPQQVPFLAAAGMRILHKCANPVYGDATWMGITHDDAKAHPGSTLSFLFFSPERLLDLKPAVQRMLTLAVRQSTDDDIADAMLCSRDYVRKLWNDAYAAMEQAGVLNRTTPSLPMHSVPIRGRERRRGALEFLRANPHELRPG